MMTAKEKQRMKRLEVENGYLREQNAKHIRRYGAVLMEKSELKVWLHVIECAVRCKKCGSEMKRGIATGQAWSGVAGFTGDSYAVTLSSGGTGYLMPCLKCVACGWSVTA